MKRAIGFKFGTDIKGGAYLRKDLKRPLSGRGRGHVTEFLNVGTPLMISERIEQSASNLAQRRRADPACVLKITRPLNVRGLGHLT